MFDPVLGIPPVCAFEFTPKLGAAGPCMFCAKSVAEASANPMTSALVVTITLGIGISLGRYFRPLPKTNLHMESDFEKGGLSRTWYATDAMELYA